MYITSFIIYNNVTAAFDARQGATSNPLVGRSAVCVGERISINHDFLCVEIDRGIIYAM